MHRTSRYLKPSSALAVLVVLTALLTGCKATTNWDKEYVCTGQEQSSTVFKGDDPARASEKKYPMTVDFHLRSQKVFVKTYVAPLESDTTGGLQFSGKNPTAWLSGHFEPSAGQLILVEGRNLDIAGRTQFIRTTGQYTCKERT